MTFFRDDDTLKLYVMRLPLEESLELTDTITDIQETYQLGLLLQAKALSYRKMDAEIQNFELADKFEAEFRDLCRQVTHDRARNRSKSRFGVRDNVNALNAAKIAATHDAQNSAAQPAGGAQ
jgi:hypothetical protein